MGLVLLNLKSNQIIQLDNENPLILGRKTIEGCSDSKISRNHGRITCTDDGKIRLTALHNNPCFYKVKDVQVVQQLNKDNEKTLSEGDSIGLLVNDFWFKIISNNDITEPSTSTQTSTADNCNSQQKQRNEVLNEGGNSSLLSTSEESVCKFGSPEFEKTKRLPLHMYEIDDLPLAVKNSNKHPLPDGDETETTENLEVVVKLEPESSEEGPTCSKVIKLENNEESSAESQEKSTKNNEKKNSVKRPICQYEEKCYRANPEHKLEFSHPGDADFVPYEQRPMCPYGAACYRKNQRHKVENRHPPRDSTPERPSSSSPASSPLPAKRRRKKIAYNLGNEDDYDLDDPFINDGSSDEYAPSDAESEEEEEEEENISTD